jgi:hypothetical protein
MASSNLKFPQSFVKIGGLVQKLKWSKYTQQLDNLIACFFSFLSGKVKTSLNIRYSSHGQRSVL